MKLDKFVPILSRELFSLNNAAKPEILRFWDEQNMRWKLEAAEKSLASLSERERAMFVQLYLKKSDRTSRYAAAAKVAGLALFSISDHDVRIRVRCAMAVTARITRLITEGEGDNLFLSEVYLPPRAYRPLNRAGITRLFDLQAMLDSGRKVEGLGKVLKDEIRATIAR